MNQSIQILDGFEYVPEHSALKLQAMVSGLLTDCYITGVERAEADAYYASVQFDLEEYLIECIEDEKWNEKGEVWISASDVN